MRRRFRDIDRALRWFDGVKDADLKLVVPARKMREAYVIGRIDGSLAERFDLFSGNRVFEADVKKRDGVIVDQSFKIWRRRSYDARRG